MHSVIKPKLHLFTSQTSKKKLTMTCFPCGKIYSIRCRAVTLFLSVAFTLFLTLFYGENILKTLYSVPGWQSTSTIYGIMFDAGSTGSRIHVFTFVRTGGKPAFIVALSYYTSSLYWAWKTLTALFLIYSGKFSRDLLKELGNQQQASLRLHIPWRSGNVSYFFSSSMRKQPTFGDATTGFPTKWRLRNERRNSILMTRHYPDLGSASDWSCRVGNLIQPIRSTTQIWVVTRHQYGISALVSQTSFGGETSGSVAKCRLFSQATLVRKCPQSGKEEQLLRGQELLFFGTLIVLNYYTNGFKLNAVSWNKVNVQIFSESGKRNFFIVLIVSAVENGAIYPGTDDL